MDIGLIGLAVMGENLALNLASRGWSVAVYNRTAEKTRAFLEGRAAGTSIAGAWSLPELVLSLDRPRKIFLMVKAGKPVDDLIEALLPLLEPGDIIIDGGNSHYHDTMRRTELAERAGLLYVGTGVSGGEEGALRGPSLMPGGSAGAWEHIKPIFESICARTDGGEPCCAWVGENGAGHFVKMVHNGIEYADMQLICEAYQLMKDGLGLPNPEMADIFEEWNKGKLKSYLIEITSDILRHKEEDGTFTLDAILDAAGQKGTGKWTVAAALDEGVPATIIGEAVFARCLSAMKEERARASALYGGCRARFKGDGRRFTEDIRRALYASKIIAYAQGFMLMSAAAGTYGWRLDCGGIALMWRGGCIIRSAFLEKIREAYGREPDLPNLLLDPYFKSELSGLIVGWRRTVSGAAKMGMPVPALSGALSWFDGWRSERLPANLLQAQRDYFGAHGYERSDGPAGELYHTEWR